MGFSHNLVRELAMEDTNELRVMFCMDLDAFNWLLDKVEGRLRKADTHLRKSITPLEKLQIAIRYLATGNYN